MHANHWPSWKWMGMRMWTWIPILNHQLISFLLHIIYSFDHSLMCEQSVCHFSSVVDSETHCSYTAVIRFHDFNIARVFTFIVGKRVLAHIIVAISICFSLQFFSFPVEYVALTTLTHFKRINHCTMHLHLNATATARAATLYTISSRH